MNEGTNRILNIPKRYHGVQGTSKYFKAYSQKHGIVFTGGVGTGKTHEAIKLLKYLYNEEGIKEPFRTCSDFAETLRSSVATHKVGAAVKAFKTKELFFIDDLGAENATEFVLEHLAAIVNYRYNELLPVILTTNLNANDFQEVYGQRIISRLIGMTKFVKLTGKDRRL